MAKTKKAKCKRGTAKTVVLSLVNPSARSYITSKGTKGAKSLLKRHLAVTTCERTDGLGRLVKKVTLTEKKLTPGGLKMGKASRSKRRPKGFSKKGWHLYNQPGASDYVARRAAPPPPPPDFTPDHYFMDGL